jgi:Flp pilus assembly pilin Flp
MKKLHQLWKDEAGFIVSTELVLIATILVIGMVVGLATVRNHVVQELGDVALAIGSINQSYMYTGVTGRELTAGGAFASMTAGSEFEDRTDFCDSLDVSSEEPAGISVQQPATPEL